MQQSKPLESSSFCSPVHWIKSWWDSESCQLSLAFSGCLSHPNCFWAAWDSFESNQSASKNKFSEYFQHASLSKLITQIQKPRFNLHVVSQITFLTAVSLQTDSLGNWFMLVGYRILKNTSMGIKSGIRHWCTKWNADLIISHIIVLEGTEFHKLGMRFSILEAAIIFTELTVETRKHC